MKIGEKDTKQEISKDMAIGEAVQAYPVTAAVMMKYGLHCIGCHVAAWESIEDGARGHGLTEDQIDNMVDDMNQAIREKKD